MALPKWKQSIKELREKMYHKDITSAEYIEGVMKVVKLHFERLDKQLKLLFKKKGGLDEF